MSALKTNFPDARERAVRLVLEHQKDSLSPEKIELIVKLWIGK